MPQSVPSAGAIYFDFPPSFRIFMSLLLVASVGFVAFFVGAPFFDQSRSNFLIVFATIGAIGFCLAALYVANVMLRMFDRVAIDQTGIWYLPRRISPRILSASFLEIFGRAAIDERDIWITPRRALPVNLPWEEIAHVEARERVQRLVLSDKEGSRTIKLEYQLGNFDALRRVVLAKTAEARSRVPAPAMFHFSRYNRAIFLGCYLVSVAAALFSFQSAQTWWTPLVWIGLAAMSAYSLAIQPSRLTVRPTSFRVDYLGWYRVVRFDAVKSIAIATVRSGQYRTSVFAAVIVKTDRKRPLKLSAVSEGSVVLCDALRSAWLASRRPGHPDQQASRLTSS